MPHTFSQLPTVLTLGALVLILSFMGRQNRTARFMMWFVAWLLIFLRSAVLLAAGAAASDPLIVGIDLAILALSGTLFLTSVSAVAEHPKLRLTLILGMAAPLVAYAFLVTRPVPSRAMLIACLLMAYAASIYHWLVAEKPGPYAWTSSGLAALVCAWCVYRLAQGDLYFGFYATMTVIYGLTAVLFYRTYRRFTPGVVAAGVGFLLWAVAHPLHHVIPQFMGSGIVTSQLWDVIKFVVAIGMIVTLLEDERIAAETARAKERLLYEQTHRFSKLTGKLLAGAEVSALGDEIAEAIVQCGLASRAAVVIASDDQQLEIAGANGFSAAERSQLLDRLGVASVDGLERITKLSSSGGESVCRIDETDYAALPLRAEQRHALLGALILETEAKTSEDFAALQVLAASLSISIENHALQQHLFRSEKLAGMGRLVGALAHELNNPLTAVLGYAEFLAGNEGHPARPELETIRRESLRMKRIIENLQRFSRKQQVHTTTVDVAATLDEVLRLREYDLQKRKIQVDAKLDPHLPPVAGDEALLNQVMLNVVNNSIDALENCLERRITIDASSATGHVTLRIADSGPGFKHLHRVFDPFFSTKEPGKGTGLGLSICYSIIRDHGGEIVASNLEPHGACITMKLPVAVAANA
jgi:two-component system, NtrC family, sensor kinase